MQLQTGTGLAGTLLLLLSIVAAGLLARRFYLSTEPAPGPAWRRLLTTLRCGSLLLVLAAALGPVLLSERETLEPGRLAVVIEDSASMAIADQGGGATRWRRALDICGMVDSLITERPGLEPVYLRGNGLGEVGDLRPMEPVPPPTAVGTDLGALVVDARQRAGRDDLRGLILVGDGNESPSLAPTVGMAGRGGGLLLGVGSQVWTPDFAVLEATCPPRAFVGDEIVVEALVAARGVPEGRVGAVLSVLGREVASADIDFAPDRTTRRIELTYRPEDAGVTLIELLLETGDNEAFRENDHATLAVDVARDSSRLLFWTARPDWNVRFLAQAARAEPRLEMVVAYPGEDGTWLAEGADWRPPRSADEWAGWDGIVMDATAAAHLTDGGRALAEAVRRGLGLLVLEGAGGAGAAQALDRLRPGRISARTATMPHVIREAVGGRSHPVMADRSLGRTSTTGAAPPVRDFRWLDPSSDATVLLEAADGPGAGRPLLVSSPFGLGRVIWSGAPDLWRPTFWQMRRLGPAPGGVHLPSLLGNLLVWTAVGGRHEGIRLPGGRMVHTEGEQILLEAFSADLRGRTHDATVVVEISRRDEMDGISPISLRLEPDPERPGLSAAPLPLLPPGRYLARLAGTNGEEGSSREIVIVPSTLEGAQMRQDGARLRSLARLMDGRYLDAASSSVPARLSEYLDGLDHAPTRSRAVSAHALLGGWRLLAAALALLTAEWLLRRRLGMI